MIGSTIGKYEIVSKIGQGAMGEVYKAHDSLLNRYVAIKTIASEMGGDDTLRKRFEREAQSAARLNHANIITIYEFGESQGKLYMAMELLEGRDLKKLIANHQPTSLDDRLSLMVQICEGLAFAHAHEVVHRDLKPANIHVLASGQVKIVDFGLARLTGSEMTRTGMVIGTPHYMSPEQVRGERADTRSDVFSIGCVFYELLTFHKAFDAPSMHSVLFKVMQEEPAPIQQLAPDVPLPLAQIVRAALAKDPASRIQNGAELLAALQQATQVIGSGRAHEPLPNLPPPSVPARPAGSDSSRMGSVVRSRPGDSQRRAAVAPAHRGAGPAAWVVGGIALLVLVGLAGVVVWRVVPGASPPPSTRPAQVDTLARAVLETQVELARKKLVGGDYAEAARDAEKALRLDPSSAEARRILDQAQSVIAESTKAAERLKAAVAKGDDAASAEAFWGLVQVAPNDPLAAEMTSHFEGRMKDQAREAQRLMGDARAAALSSGADKGDRFLDGDARRREADDDFKAGRFASAARRYVDARNRFRLVGKS